MLIIIIWTFVIDDYPILTHFDIYELIPIVKKNFKGGKSILLLFFIRGNKEEVYEVFC